MIDYLNQKSGKHFRDTKTNRDLIKARLNEGFTSKDIATAIDNVCQAWLNNPKMVRYIQPSTIFKPSKFEGYVNNPPFAPNDNGQVVQATKQPEWMDKDYQPKQDKMSDEDTKKIKDQLAELKKMQEAEE